MKTVCLTLALFAIFALASAGHKKEDMFKLRAKGMGLKNLKHEEHHDHYGHGYHHGSSSMMSPIIMPPIAHAASVISPIFMPPMNYMPPPSYYSPSSSYMRPVIYEPYPSYVPVGAGSEMSYEAAPAPYPYRQSSRPTPFIESFVYYK